MPCTENCKIKSKKKKRNKRGENRKKKKGKKMPELIAIAQSRHLEVQHDCVGRFAVCD